ncbi:Calcipressin-domain-containing protein [Viridothelium virens]|uniref:Calcipressin-domain-containing protein n=1 Tax=Viridothelium virens TaxID=1048519 RepID=A0A6A6HEV8_VIRVR|nr:Calcipressin-domain-containing protein [Viridothelium virens]
MAAETSTPPVSNTSSPSSRGRKSPPLSLDLSDLPALSQPSPPSNTLLITNLNEPTIFHPTNLQTIRDLLSSHAPLHSFSPLKSFRRLVVSFETTEAAISIRQALDGSTIMGLTDRIRVYFGQPTPINPEDQHLQAPKSQKLFFISPPPSPPAGWEIRDEEPPNKEVHAEDLAGALAKLHARGGSERDTEAEPEWERQSGGERRGENIRDGDVKGVWAGRQRSGSSTIVYHPDDHGDSPALPAIAVEDTTESPGDLTPMEGDEASDKRFYHTPRPPVELMSNV